MQNTFFPGQRWISEAEPDLGLGLVVETGDRRVKVVFLATEEERSYASETAPLSRVCFRPEEIAKHGEGWEFEITDVDDINGLLLYQGSRVDNGEEVSVIETQLAHDMRVNQPQDRLFTNQFDRHRAFELRYHSLKQRAKLLQSPVRGIVGSRIDAIAHQLYIAQEVASRPEPRVLLADEVGLGKTVEAGLIIHHQLLTERANRVLIVVPQALVSQWLLELMRRFNLPAAVFDAERCEDAEFINPVNPFLTEQVVVCSLEFLKANPNRANQAANAEWDILVVDEAHHLAWSEDDVSDEYALIEAIAELTPGLLLLTATPEQLGVASHFARLRLLDPDRFDSLAQFIADEEGYHGAASAVEALVDEGNLSDDDYAKIQAFYPDIAPKAELESDSDVRQRAVRSLVDRHGTGRVLFRNTRAHVKGFPDRELNSYPQPSSGDQDQWLVDWLKSHSDKALIICASKERATALEHRLTMAEGIQSAAFHEDLGLLARDRAAAWFADQEGGAQALVCSEIGSEGRNFQFARHLVLLDLPANPDLLEQRIGRLDRIGQKNTIQIHVPYVEGGREERLFQWYHLGMNAFEKNCKAGSAVYQAFGDDVAGDKPLETLVADTQAKVAEINDALENGRDRLLELSSYNQEQALQLVQQLLEANDYYELEDYFENMCDAFGIDTEEHSEHCMILTQGNHYKGGFKDISEDGITVTFDRDIALSNEDFKFITWEHPLVRDGMDQVLTNTTGNAAIGTVKMPGLPEGLTMIECLFTVSTMAAKDLEMGRYLPPQLLRVVIDSEMRSIGKVVTFDALERSVRKVDRQVAKKIIDSGKPTMEKMIERAQKLAQGALPKLVEKGKVRIEEQLSPELARLEYLQTVNPSVREEEVETLRHRVEDTVDALASASVQLDAVRLLISVG